MNRSGLACRVIFLLNTSLDNCKKKVKTGLKKALPANVGAHLASMVLRSSYVSNWLLSIQGKAGNKIEISVYTSWRIFFKRK